MVCMCMLPSRPTLTALLSCTTGQAMAMLGRVLRAACGQGSAMRSAMRPASSPAALQHQQRRQRSLLADPAATEDPPKILITGQ